jgi:hypothetical protein
MKSGEKKNRKRDKDREIQTGRRRERQEVTNNGRTRQCEKKSRVTGNEWKLGSMISERTGRVAAPYPVGIGRPYARG